MCRGSSQLQVLDAEHMVKDGLHHHASLLTLRVALPSLGPLYDHGLQPLLKHVVHHQHVQLIHTDLHTHMTPESQQTDICGKAHLNRNLNIRVKQNAEVLLFGFSCTFISLHISNRVGRVSSLSSGAGGGHKQKIIRVTALTD